MVTTGDRDFPDTGRPGQRLDKERIARAFAASIGRYDASATVQGALADALVEQIAGYGGIFRRGLEIGCGTGYLSRKLATAIGLERFYLNDLSTRLCDHAARRLTGACSVEILPGDIEALPLPSALDLVVSSSTFQWLEDMERLFIKVASALERGGLFAFTLFGAGTMAEIAALSGRGLHYMDFADISLLLEKKFTINQSEQVRETLFFPSVLAIFRHIRNTGVGGLGQTRWTRATLKEFERRYYQRFGTERGLPVSYCAYTFLATAKREGDGA